MPRPRVLIVYDQVDTPDKYLSGLRECGLDVLFAMDIATALVLTVTQLPNAIVVDMRAEGAAQRVFLKRVAEDTRAQIIPVVVVADPETVSARDACFRRASIYPRVEAPSHLGFYLSRWLAPIKARRSA
jgi:CheY-like chemotaxis protein